MNRNFSDDRNIKIMFWESCWEGNWCWWILGSERHL